MVIEKRGSTPALANSHLGGTFVVLAFLAGAMVWLRYLMGFVAPLVLGGTRCI